MKWGDRMTKFTSVVSRIKAAVRRRAAVKGTVSAVDVSNVSRKSTRGERRGAVIRRVFADLVDEGFLVATSAKQYNSDTRHSVTVYRVRGSR
jgi:hypothetical protein